MPTPPDPPPPPQCTRCDGRTRVNGSGLLSGRPPVPIPGACRLRGPSAGAGLPPPAPPTSPNAAETTPPQRGGGGGGRGIHSPLAPPRAARPPPPPPPPPPCPTSITAQGTHSPRTRGGGAVRRPFRAGRRAARRAALVDTSVTGLRRRAPTEDGGRRTCRAGHRWGHPWGHPWGR